MLKSKQRSLHNKRGFTLVEVIVVVAILAICSGMLVGVIAGSVDRYSKASDIESCKQESINFEEYYKKCVRGAFAITQEADFSSSSFTTQENFYYMIISPQNHSVRFAMANDSGGFSNLITCNYVDSIKYKTNNVGKEDSQTYMDYQISMRSGYQPGVTYDYPGTVIMNNGAAITVPETEYVLDNMTDDVCISFRMVP